MNKSLPCNEVNVMLSFGSRGGSRTRGLYFSSHLPRPKEVSIVIIVGDA